MGKSNKFLFVLSIIILIVLIIIIYLLYTAQQGVIVEVQNKLNETEETGVSCPPSGITKAKVKYEDILAERTTYHNTSKVYFISETEQDIEVKSLFIDDWSSKSDLICGMNYTPIALTELDKTSSSLGYKITAQGPEVSQVLKGSKIRQLQIKVKDLINDNYLIVTNAKGSSNIEYQQLDNDNTNITDAVGFTILDIESDDYLDILIEVKTNETLTTFGEEGLNVYMCIDANKDKWDEPLVSINKVELKNVYSSLNNNDMRVLSNYDYCYDIGIIGDITKEIFYYQETASKTNPTSQDSPILYFIAEGRFLSEKETDNKDDKVIKSGFFRDDDLNSQVEVKNRQQFQINII